MSYELNARMQLLHHQISIILCLTDVCYVRGFVALRKEFLMCAAWVGVQRILCHDKLSDAISEV